MSLPQNETSTQTIERPAGSLLVVDTDSQHLFYTATLLQRFGYEVIKARSAMGALEMLKTTVPLLVLTELDLPQVGGFELLQRVRSDARTARVPVIALYRSEDLGNKARCSKMAFAGCLVKPVGAEDLFRAVQNAVEQHRRGTLRVHARLTVLVNDRPVDCVDGTCSSILSEHGMYLCTIKPYPRDARLSLQMSLNGRIISADGVVLYSHQFGEGPLGEAGMGIKFSRMDPHDRNYLRSFIHNKLTGDLALNA
jgi:CheY-like chemotaxis protein